MKVKRKCCAILIGVILLVTLSACHTSVSLTFQIENGDKVKVKLDTTDGYRLLEDQGTLSVQKDGETILNGYFLTAEGYAEKVSAIQAASAGGTAQILDQTPESPSFYYYQFEGKAGTETIYLFQVEGTDTGAIFGGLGEQKEIEAAFELLEVTKGE